MSVFITGATSGIGEACAWAAAEAGWDLVLAARREVRLKEISAAIAKQHNVRVDWLELDVREKSAVEKWVKANASLAGGIGALVNNAGLAQGLDPLQTGNTDDWDVMIDTNVKGLLYTTRALLPTLIANRGHIVNLGSVAGHWTYPNGNVYCATKYAVRSLTETLRWDLHGTGVRVTEIAPGMVETAFSEVRFKGDSERAKKVYADTHPLSARDIAESVVWAMQRPKHVNIQALVIFPVDQASVTLVKRDGRT